MTPKASKKFRIHIVELRNLTTRVPLKNARVPGKREELIQFHEWIDGGVVLEVPRNVCSKGNSIEVTFQTEGSSEMDFSTHVTGTVTEIESVPGSHVSVHLRFVQFIAKDWSAIRKEFETLQDRVENLFRKMKE